MLVLSVPVTIERAQTGGYNKQHQGGDRYPTPPSLQEVSMPHKSLHPVTGKSGAREQGEAPDPQAIDKTEQTDHAFRPAARPADPKVGPSRPMRGAAARLPAQCRCPPAGRAPVDGADCDIGFGPAGSMAL